MLARNPIAVILVLLVLLGGLPRATQAGGWSWKMPPRAVTLDSGRRNPIFYVGEPINFTIGGAGATHYEVRDYYGTLTESGEAGSDLSLKPLPPGWYKLYVYGDVGQGAPWGKIVGGTTIAVFRHDPHFPPLLGKNVPGDTDGASDQPTRAVIGMGPERLAVPDAGKPEEAIQTLDAEIALEKRLYLPYDPLRKRALLVAFPNGTQNLAGVRKIVAHFQNDVRYWEPRNEPNGGSSGANFAVKEMKPFYETVKSVNPKLKVLGPGTVTITPAGGMLGWIEDFLKAGGGKYIDAFSFHAYNSINGDVEMGRQALETLGALLTRYGLGGIEKWQTEQGFMAAVYGAYQPRLQGRWTMDQMMVYEQQGIPKEHNHYWYDLSHGFWDVPVWWENEDRGVNPAASLLRVWSEELYGTNFQRAYDLGPAGNPQYLGSEFSGPGKRVAAFLSAGDPSGQITLSVRGGKALHMVSPFGVAQDLPIANGRVTLPVSELPVYVELAAEQTLQALPMDYGPNLALQSGVTISAPGDPAEAAKLHNGRYENWYYTQAAGSGPWTDLASWGKAQDIAPPSDPISVEIRLPSAQKIARVVVYAAPPWQMQSTLLNFDLQYETGGQWKTIQHVWEPTRTFRAYSPGTRTTVDSFFSDRWVFPITFRAVIAQKIRLQIHDATFGGGATKDVIDAGGQCGPRHVTLREVEIYGR